MLFAYPHVLLHWKFTTYRELMASRVVKEEHKLFLLTCLFLNYNDLIVDYKKVQFPKHGTKQYNFNDRKLHRYVRMKLSQVA